MTIVLIIVNALVYGFQWILPASWLRAFEGFFGLSTEGVLDGHWWQFVTYAFLHANFMHLLVNMLGLWFGGRLVERMIGPGRLFLLYLFAAVAGGVLQLALTGQTNLLLGASAAVCGIVIAFTSMLPESELLVLLFFIIPIRLRAKFLGGALVLTSLFFLIVGWEPWIGHAAHLGGCLAGFLFVRLSGFAPAGRLESWIYGFLKKSPARR